ncbi:hypothetical protein [Streptomyces uncialis]|uniref:hypothetical protein n=1 Tax=Streptomyces uncialis TaxID=1048205 RepID=UPI0022518F47|nr:hypothetical protein [Streptomyces uncialis]MCX4664573.1 hypothetical protein [Streptomyces uncialis]
MRKAVGALLATTALALTTGMTFGAGSAAAQSADTTAAVQAIHATTASTGNGVRVTYYAGTERLGYGEWHQNAQGLIQDDTLEVVDFGDTTYEFVAQLSDGRRASTVGQTDNVDRVTRNLPEGSTHTMRVCLVQNTGTNHCASTPVTA